MKYLLVVVGLAGVLFAAFVALRQGHFDCRLPVRVTGRILEGADRAAVSGAFVMTLRSREHVEQVPEVERRTERIGEWNALLEEVEKRRSDSPHPFCAPELSGGGQTQVDGTFSFVFTIPWSYDVRGLSQSNPSYPPPRHGIQVLRIEIAGRDPVILDVPEGTWTQHDGEDGLWATWDLGVVEVP